MAAGAAGTAGASGGKAFSPGMAGTAGFSGCAGTAGTVGRVGMVHAPVSCFAEAAAFSVASMALVMASREGMSAGSVAVAAVD